ncbi:hypothetical protein [Taibaiella koreensis]|uniref:hypothetical protein n=1 Tax=Taibaiella koreensis TaxID=1268548 RepID=UPI000E5A0362|nr:hypothetical protein [Taibaiella koreensis]
MTQQPFTQAGVNAKLKELALLPGPERLRQTDTLTSNFRGWMAQHFKLSDQQNKYLSGLDERFVRYTAAQLYVGINSDVPVGVVVPDPSDPRSSKLTLTDGFAQVGDDTKGGYAFTGKATIVFRYQ